MSVKLVFKLLIIVCHVTKIVIEVLILINVYVKMGILMMEKLFAKVKIFKRKIKNYNNKKII